MKKSYYPPRKEHYASDLRNLIEQSSYKYPNKSAFCFKRNNMDYSVSYSDFYNTVVSLSASFSTLFGENAHIAVVGDKCVEWIAVYFAVIMSGNVIVPLDKELNDDKLRNFAAFTDTDCIVYTQSYAKCFEGFEASLPKVRKYIEISTDSDYNNESRTDVNVESDLHIPFTDFYLYGNGLVNANMFSISDIHIDMEKMCAIILTSGTTGSSKGVMLSQKNLIHCLNESCQLFELTKDDVLVSVLPLHHTYEMMAGILAPLFIGSAICINDSIRHVTRDFQTYKPTKLALVPLFVTNIYKKIIDNAQKNKKLKKFIGAVKMSNRLRKAGIDLRKVLFSEISDVFGGRLDCIMCGGAPMPAEYVDKFEEIGINLTQGYGITECSPVIALLPIGLKRPHSCGLLLKGIQCYIDRDSAGDASGEIIVKGDNIMLGYYKNPESTKEVLSDRGWFRTGDCGYIDKEGFLYITGRKKNVIVLENGKNVFPEEVEEYLENLPLVEECVVVGRQSKGENIKITAIIYPNYEKAKAEGIEGDERLKELFYKQANDINRRLASYKHIRAIEIRSVPFIKTTTKKIQRHKIDIYNN